jgi:hypothetical protein
MDFLPLERFQFLALLIGRQIRPDDDFFLFVVFSNKYFLEHEKWIATTKLIR